MSAAALAALAAALGVLALWELLAAAERLVRGDALRALVAPLARARRAGAEPSAAERRRLAVLATLVLAAAGWLVAGPLAGAALATGAPWLSRALVRRRRERYRAELARAAPAVARAVADALAAGHAISRALGEAARSLDGAAALELAAVERGLALGRPLEDALAALQARAGRAYDTLAAAILLQRDAGGDLVGLLRELARAHEAAVRCADDARAATAQARFTGGMVVMLPLGGALLVELASPGFLKGLATSFLTAWLVGLALLMQVAAAFLIRRLSRFKA